MPELPEVETIRLSLEKKLVGKTIKDIEILAPKSFLGNSKLVQDKKIIGLWRKAKILGIDLSGNKTLLIHLKMSGQLIYESEERFIGGHPTPDMVLGMPNKSTRVIFEFNDKSRLYFNDQRRFGWIKVVTNSEVTSNKLFVKLGPEPLEKDFSWQTLKSRLLHHKSLPIKVALLDQTIVSGIGNIYASEACFNAGLDPRKRVSELTDGEFKNLHQGIIKSLREGIKYGGSTKTHFVDPDGKKGYFLDYAFVYWKENYPCKNCGTEIKKIQLRGRGTYFCPSCQKP